MIINETVSSPVLTSVVSAPSRFKIKASAKAFKILSGFYSEPILAIPRELGANAWDSHVKAGNTNKMFEVHAPNTLEPWFSVRDFGTGLSPEAVDTIYTTYFESTKTADNDSDGCMGLGSKTPFNYTENFTVTSFYNGKKYVYNCYIDESGAPNIMHMATVDTDEHNGLEVKFGVKIADISMWVDKITRAYEPFRYRPTIKGVSITYPARKYTYQGKTWAMRESTSRYDDRQSYAFMGNYCYPISSNVIVRVLNNKNMQYLGNMLNYASFDFFFDIGDLEVAPNKEQLQYDDTNDTTASAIISAMKVAYNELRENVKKSIEIPKTRWEAMCLYNKYNSYESPHASIRNIIGDINISFNGQRIDYNNVSCYTLRSSTLTGLSTNLTIYSVERRNNRYKVKKTDNFVASYSRGTLFYYSNTSNIKKSRILHHLVSKNYSDNNFPNVRIIVDETNGNNNVSILKNHFGWTDVEVLSVESLPKPPPAPRIKKVVGTDEVYVASIKEFFDTTKNSNKSVIWSRRSATINSTDTNYYIDFHYSYPVNVSGSNTNISEHMDDMICLLANEKAISSEIIYGINSKNKNLLKVGKWVNILDLAKNTVKLHKEKYEQKVYMYNQRNHIGEFSSTYNKLARNPSIIANISNEDTRNMFKTFVSTYSKVALDSSNCINVGLMNILGIVGKKHSDLPFDFVSFKNALNTKYFGMMDTIDVYSSNASVIYKLINFIDEKS